MFSPKRTFESVIVELVEGLETGDIELESSSDIEPVSVSPAIEISVLDGHRSGSKAKETTSER